jgi:UDP-2-acetamido-3-amino-2,3-dideoxy-glucuronate N-acetyltransferase
MSIKIGLIGGGYWGKNLVKNFNMCSVLHTICEINEVANKQYNELYPHVHTTTKWSDVLSNDEITAVCISLPADMHYQYAKEALNSNKDVYVEKPITLKIEEAEELVELAKEKNKILMVGHLLQYHPCIVKIKELVKGGEIGKIKNIVSNRFNLGIFRVQENVLWSSAVHDISVILSLCNNKLPDEIQCNGKSVLTKGVHDITNTIMKYNDDDIYVNINVNWLNPFKEQKLTIIAEHGMIVFDDMQEKDKIKIYKNYIVWKDGVPTAVKTDGEVVEVDMGDSPLLLECKHFIECCVTRKNPKTDGEEAKKVLTVLEKSQESLEKNGEIVKVNSKKIDYYVHPTAIVDDGAKIGHSTRIWHYSHICSTAVIGSNCNIGQNAYIAGKIGDGCKLQNGISLYLGVTCEDNVFIGPHATFTNDKSPRCEYPKNGVYIKTLIKQGSSIGANSTILCGNTIGEYSMIGAGSVVTHDVDAYSVVAGNPSKQVATIDKYGNISQ